MKYFTGKVSDGKKTIRIASFNPVLRSRLHDSLSGSSSVALTDCQVKKDNYNSELEIIASAKRSHVESSPRKFKLSEDIQVVDPDVSKRISIEELNSINQGAWIWR